MVGRLAGSRWAWVIGATVLVSVALQALLALRTGLTVDEPLFLDLGRSFASGSPLHPAANIMSGGGSIPGCLLELLVGLPTTLSTDYRILRFIISFVGLAAALLLTFTLRQAMGIRFAAIFLALYALSPWLLLNSTLVWNPSFLFLAAAAHFWACWHLRGRASFLPSLILAAALALSPQLHGSFVILMFLTAFLVFKRLVRLDFKGMLAGGLLGALPLIPSALAYYNGTFPSPLPSWGFFGKGLIDASVIRAAGYWLRMGSLEIARLREATYFSGPDGTGGWGGYLLAQSLAGVCYLSVAASAAAFWWYFKRRQAGAAEETESAAWVRKYALYSLAAVLLAAAISPTRILSWHVVIALHAALLPVTAWVEHLWDQPRPAFRWLVPAYAAIRVVVLLVILFGHPAYGWQPRHPRELVKFRLASTPEGQTWTTHLRTLPEAASTSGQVVLARVR